MPPQWVTALAAKPDNSPRNCSNLPPRPTFARAREFLVGTGIVAANFYAMITMVCIFVGLFLVEVFAAHKAPMGYQDETGFHLGQPHTISMTRSLGWN